MHHLQCACLAAETRRKSFFASVRLSEERLLAMEKLWIYVLGFALSWVTLVLVRRTQLRQLILLGLSYLLYATWGKWFLALLVLSTVSNYALGRYLQHRVSVGRLWLGIAFNLVLLGTFKYLPGFATAVPFHSLRSGLQHIALPLGISFWTFEALSWLLELYREENLDPSLLEFCLFMAFWPTVISGPICRLSSMLPQFRRLQAPSWEDLCIGMRRMGLGLLMLALARVEAAGLVPGQGVNAGFARTSGGYSGIDVWFLAVGYGFQLFLDFAGYSSLVIGAARFCGFELPENFQRPYLSSTPSVFWTRWHMSLSFWIRDFLFMPLATRRRGFWWRSLSLLISMILFGLWHKGTLLFFLWGAFQGLLLVLHRLWQRLFAGAGLKVPELVMAPMGWLATFSGISLGWIFFRAQNLHQAFAMLRAIAHPGGYAHRHLPSNFYLLTTCIAVGYFAVAGVTGLLDRVATPANAFFQSSLVVLWQERWVWVTPLVAVLAMYAYLVIQIQQTNLNSPFLYQLF